MESTDTPNVLIVDDTPAGRYAMRTALERLPARVLEAGSGAEALALIAQHEFAVVLLDVMMPEMDGFELLARLNKVAGPERIPIIFITAHNRSLELESSGYSLGAVDYLYKPIEPEHLRTKVRFFLELHEKRRQLEASVQALEQAHSTLQSSNDDLKQFAHGASHDLKAPTRRIKGFAQLLGKTHREQLDEDGLKYLDFIMVESNRMESLVESILGFARAGEAERQLGWVDLQTVVEKVKERMLHQIDDREMVIEVSELPVIEADDGQMSQVFENLIGNAIKYARENIPPKIQISAKYLDAESCIAVEVRDNGKGIESSRAVELFEPFRRGASSSGVEGSGFGLAIVRRIVERHQGRITADGEPGKGAIFTLKLPCRQAALANPA